VKNRLLRGIVTVLVTLLLWFSPFPGGVTQQAWHLLAIFIGTITGLILQPVPMGAVVLIGTTATMLTHTLTLPQALSGYMNQTVWLIVAAFLFGRAFIKTGLGRRIAYFFIGAFGHRTLGLGYALAVTDLILAPGIPSGAARTGGVLFPVVKSLAATYQSEPGPTASRIGSFLMLSAYMVHAVTCSMFLTSMVANPQIAVFARETAQVEITWAGWATAALVPGLISFVMTPYLVFRLTRPEIRKTPEAAGMARSELSKMGKLSRNESVVLGVFLLTFLLWVTGSWTGLEPTVVAFFGLSLMLIFGALTWEDVLSERSGWDALIWFGGLVAMATMLRTLGLLTWFSEFVASHVAGWAWLPALAILALVYMYSHYLFASLSAHVAAFYIPFLTVALAVGAPPYFAALTFAFFSSLCSTLTHYGGGPSPVYWGAGYTDIRQWWTVGFAMSLLFVAVWMGIGPFWWKALGLF
jgi:DASS family divalent anion:Na+ symporter